ncbi:uncharacterized protein JCM15063_006231 [Sporobolomyces koalae]|uniref:uncharacterized protein n=1 Tax=Sporobolomyces koalae TaxID=500713 RepID=UPI0031791EBD
MKFPDEYDSQSLLVEGKLHKVWVRKRTLLRLWQRYVKAAFSALPDAQANSARASADEAAQEPAAQASATQAPQQTSSSSAFQISPRGLDSRYPHVLASGGMHRRSHSPALDPHLAAHPQASAIFSNPDAWAGQGPGPFQHFVPNQPPSEPLTDEQPAQSSENFLPLQDHNPTIPAHWAERGTGSAAQNTPFLRDFQPSDLDPRVTMHAGDMGPHNVSFLHSDNVYFSDPSNASSHSRAFDGIRYCSHPPRPGPHLSAHPQALSAVGHPFAWMGGGSGSFQHFAPYDPAPGPLTNEQSDQSSGFRNFLPLQDHPSSAPDHGMRWTSRTSTDKHDRECPAAKAFRMQYELKTLTVEGKIHKVLVRIGTSEEVWKPKVEAAFSASPDAQANSSGAYDDVRAHQPARQAPQQNSSFEAIPRGPGKGSQHQHVLKFGGIPRRSHSPGLGPRLTGHSQASTGHPIAWNGDGSDLFPNFAPYHGAPGALTNQQSGQSSGYSLPLQGHNLAAPAHWTEHGMESADQSIHSRSDAFRILPTLGGLTRRDDPVEELFSFKDYYGDEPPS